jgi:acetolactate synthase regulatory subunit
MRGVASKATTSIEQLLNNQITKFTDFEVVKITNLTYIALYV